MSCYSLNSSSFLFVRMMFMQFFLEQSSSQFVLIQPHSLSSKTSSLSIHSSFSLQMSCYFPFLSTRNMFVIFLTSTRACLKSYSQPREWPNWWMNLKESHSLWVQCIDLTPSVRIRSIYVGRWLLYNLQKFRGQILFKRGSNVTSLVLEVG